MCLCVLCVFLSGVCGCVCVRVQCVCVCVCVLCFVCALWHLLQALCQCPLPFSFALKMT